MKKLSTIVIALFAILFFSGCFGKSGSNTSEEKVNHADTVYLGDLRDKFKDDSLFFNVVVPDLYLSQYQYFWGVTLSEAIEKGLTKEYYENVKKEVSATNEAIKRGVMKGADKNRIPDFQKMKSQK